MNEITAIFTPQIDDQINQTVTFVQPQSFPKKNKSNSNIEYLEENTRLSKIILTTVEKIKTFSIKYMKCWMNSTRDHFKFDVTFKQILPSFIFAINPFKINNI